MGILNKKNKTKYLGKINVFVVKLEERIQYLVRMYSDDEFSNVGHFTFYCT